MGNLEFRFFWHIMPSHLCFSKVNSPPERADTSQGPMADASHLLVVYHCFSDYSGSLAHLLMWNFLGIPSYSSHTSLNALSIRRKNNSENRGLTGFLTMSSLLLVILLQCSSSLVQAQLCCGAHVAAQVELVLFTFLLLQWQYWTWALTKNIERLWYSPGIQNVVAQ